MSSERSVFERTYEHYLERIGKIDLKSVEKVLGVAAGEDTIEIPFFETSYSVSSRGISGPNGNRPSLEVCVALSRYLLMCPAEIPVGENWVSYRDFKDTGPLTVYFENDVESAVVRHFEGKIDALEASCRAAGGCPPDITLDYDVSFRFGALPRVPLLLLFNDRDEEFPPKCSVLFKANAEKFLDGESLAILGRILFTRLRDASPLHG